MSNDGKEEKTMPVAQAADFQPILHPLSVKDARDYFSDFINKRKVGLVRNQRMRDEARMVALLPIDLLEFVLKQFTIKPIIKWDETTKQWECLIDELDIGAFAPTKEEAIEELIDLALGYAEDYMNNLNLYSLAPNRRQHFPYILRIAMSENRDEVKGVLGLGDSVNR